MTNDKPASPAQKTKTCRKCGRTLPTPEFYGSPINRDGCRRQCKDCEKAANRERARIKRQASPGEPALVTLSPGVSPGAPPDAQPPHYGRLSKLPLQPYAEVAAQAETMARTISLLRGFYAEAYNQGLKAGRRLALEKIRATLELEETEKGGAVSW